MISSIRDACSDILAQCDGPDVTLQSASWVPGWEKLLAKALRQAVSPGKHSTSATFNLVDDFVRELQRDLADGVAGPTAFQSLLRNFSRHFDVTDPGTILAKLTSYGVPTDTTFAAYIRSLR